MLHPAPFFDSMEGGKIREESQEKEEAIESSGHDP
jgi:hypothetical protein